MALVIYVPTQWVNGTAPAINSTKLNHIENGIKEVTDAALANQVAITNLMPANAIIMFSGVVIPDGWALCDGTQGTPDLVGKFIIGGTSGDTGVEGGSRDAVVVTHNHTGSASADGDHQHRGRTWSYSGGSAYATAIQDAKNDGVGTGLYHEGGGHTSFTATATSYYQFTGTLETHAGEGTHSHAVAVTDSGESGVDKNLPPFYTLAYIMKLA